jgi:NAD-dependent SIR2 family protein deacetylase
MRPSEPRVVRFWSVIVIPVDAHRLLHQFFGNSIVERMHSPAELVEQFARGNGVVFVGAGLSVAAGLPSWADLMTQLANDLKDCPSHSSYLDVAQYYEIEYGRHRLVQALNDRLDTAGIGPTKIHREIIKLPVHAIFTTNYDDLLERTLREAQRPFSTIISDTDATFWSSDRLQLVKLHGDLHYANSIIATAQDYEHFPSLRPALCRLLGTTLQARTVLFLGYSVTDPDLRLILAQIRLEAGRLARNLYSIQFRSPRLRTKDLEWRGVKVIELPSNSTTGSYSEALSSWLASFAHEVCSQREEAVSPGHVTISIEGKVPRTKRIISSVQHILRDAEVESPENKTVRLRQGFSAFSLGSDDHPEEPEYQELLIQEKAMFVKLFQSGFAIRGLLAKRPVFAEDMYDISARTLHRWRTWLNRCRTLVEFIETARIAGKSQQLLLVPTSRSHMNDFSIGNRLLVRGIKSSVGASYDLTLFTTDPQQILMFNREFDEQFGREIELYTAGKEREADPHAILGLCLTKLKQQELEIGNRVHLLEIAVREPRTS